MTWRDHVANWKDCQRCPLGSQRGRICLARACSSGDPPGTYGGSLPCEVLFIGEAPGTSEDAVGLPFVGPAGELLDHIRKSALPDDVACAYTNLVACFPREAKAAKVNEPERGEILECRPLLIEFVNLAKPMLIVCVGELAAQHVRHKDTVACVDIVHPAYIIARMPPAQKRFAVDKCVVQVRNAYEDALRSNRPFTQWGKDAEASSWREEIRQIYTDADIPF